MESATLCIVVVILIAVINTPGVASRRGDKGRIQNLIVGGTPARQSRHRWHAMVLKGGGYVCGGALVHDRLVATAKHCIQIDGDTRYSVLLGAHNLDALSGNEVHLDVLEIIHVPAVGVLSTPGDIVLLKLSPHSPFNTAISPLPIVSQRMPIRAGTRCYISGFGVTIATGNSVSLLIHEARMKPVSNEECQKVFKDEIVDSKICVISHRGNRKSACRGDSGGPLVCRLRGHWNLVGIINGGSPNCEDAPTVCLRMASYRSFIKNIGSKINKEGFLASYLHVGI